MQGFNHGKPLVGIFVFSQVIAGTFHGKLAVTQQVVNELECFDILGPEIAVALFVFAGLYKCIELIAPHANERMVNMKHFGYLADGIILFLEQYFVFGYFD